MYKSNIIMKKDKQKTSRGEIKNMVRNLILETSSEFTLIVVNYLSHSTNSI